MGSTTPRQMVLSYIKKLARDGMMNNKVSNVSPTSPFIPGFPLWFPSKNNCDLNCKPSKSYCHLRYFGQNIFSQQHKGGRLFPYCCVLNGKKGAFQPLVMRAVIMRAPRSLTDFCPGTFLWTSSSQGLGFSTVDDQVQTVHETASPTAGMKPKMSKYPRYLRAGWRRVHERLTDLRQVTSSSGLVIIRLNIT